MNTVNAIPIMAHNIRSNMAHSKVEQCTTSKQCANILASMTALWPYIGLIYEGGAANERHFTPE